ncbi:MAG: MmcQ/YjbR family DNA-binding protein [Clostridia bacterium]|nr:MmcQ/YjbR family DNA-binding protein [Clostridia bacterium]MBT7121608.1 MmcQ/YjbR family DNA-binding protein [Clostridia bacterium]
MTIEEITEYCLQLKNAYVDLPFGATPMCIKIHGKIFAQIYADKITLKCDRIAGEYYRATYKENVVSGYHCPPVQKPFFITVALEPEIADEIVREMIEHAYVAVIRKLPQKVRSEYKE